jgi:ABC-type amino acid transport system permease subunit
LIGRFCAIGLVSALLCSFASFVYGGFIWALNSLLASIGAFVVAAASFLHYVRIVRNAPPPDENWLRDEDKASVPKAPYVLLFFAPLRFAGYLALILFFFLLRRFGALEAAAFLTGLFALPLSALIFAISNGTRFAGKGDRNKDA